jgi:hypothetical protein
LNIFYLNLAPDQIAMLEPLGVAHNAVERLDVKGEDALIIGCVSWSGYGIITSTQSVENWPPSKIETFFRSQAYQENSKFKDIIVKK